MSEKADNRRMWRTFIAEYLPLSLLIMYDIVKLSPLSKPAPTGRVPTMDGIVFLSEATNILNFHELGWQGYFAPMFYPLVTALFGWVTKDIFYAGLLVSALARLLLIIVVYLFARSIYGNKVGIASSLLLVFTPHIRAISGSPQSESLYTLLITLSLYFFWRMYNKKSYLLAVLTGIAFTMAYLTRSEGFFILLFLLAMAFILQLKRRTLNKKALIAFTLVLTVFLCTSFPYFLYLKNHYGTWTIGTKTSSVYFWLREKAFKDPDPRTEWMLSPEGEINLISLKSKELIDYWLRDPGKSLHVYLANLKKEMPGFIPNSSGMSHFPQTYPLYIVIPAILGVFLRFSKKVRLDGDILLSVPFLILFIFPLFTEGWWRYLTPYSPLLSILASSGFKEIHQKIIPPCATEHPFHRILQRSDLFIFLPVLLISGYHYGILFNSGIKGTVKTYNINKINTALEAEKAGLWAKGRFSEKTNYMILPSSRLPFYLGGKWTVMPQSTYPAMLQYAKKNSVDYVVYEFYDRSTYEKIIARPPKEMKLEDVYKNHDVSYYVLFYKLPQ